jgi:TPR repeat protein
MNATFDRNSLPSCAAAAEAGVIDAQFCLGIHYANGLGIDRDYVVAHKWLNLAAMQGDPSARDVRCELALEMSTHDIAEAQRLAREWTRTH